MNALDLAYQQLLDDAKRDQPLTFAEVRRRTIDFIVANHGFTHEEVESAYDEEINIGATR